MAYYHSQLVIGRWVTRVQSRLMPHTIRCPIQAHSVPIAQTDVVLV